MKARNSLLRSVFILAVSLLLLLPGTLAWFQSITADAVDGVYLNVGGTSFTFFQSLDADLDGLPDTDTEGNVVYAPQNPQDVTIDGVYPGHATAYRVVIDPGGGTHILGVALRNLSPADGNGVDPAAVLRIRFVDPTDAGLVDADLASLEDGNGDVVLLQGYAIHDGPFSFDYRIYMDEAAGNQYKGMEFTIGEVVFLLT